MSTVPPSITSSTTKRTKLSSKMPEKLEVQSPLPAAKQILTYEPLATKVSLKGKKLAIASGSGSDSHTHSLRSKWASASKSLPLSATSSISSLEKKTSQDSLFRKGTAIKTSAKAANSPTKSPKSSSSSSSSSATISPVKEKGAASLMVVSKDNLKRAITRITSPKSVPLTISTANTKPKISFAPQSPKIAPTSPTFITSSIAAQPPALASVFSSTQGHGLSLPETLDNPDIFAFIKYLQPLSPSQKKSSFLLPKKTRSTPKLTVVLDLDETLVHCNTQAGMDATLSFPVLFNGQEYTITGNLRPHCKEFLAKCAEKFEIVLFTASQKIYADQLATIIDPDHSLFKHRLFRDSCTFVAGNYLKDLDGLGRDLSKTVIVDNSPQAFGYHINNGIPIKSWYEDKSDNELLKVFTFLEQLERLDDVRPLIKSTFGLEDLIYCASHHPTGQSEIKIMIFANPMNTADRPIRLKRFLLRYFPPSIIVEYFESDGLFKSQKIDLHDLDASSNIDDLASKIIENYGIIPSSKHGKVVESLKKLQTKITQKKSYYLSQKVRAHSMPLTNAVFDKSGKRFLTGSYDRTVKIWDTDSGHELHSLQGHSNAVYAIAFNAPFSDKIATGSFDRTAKLWDAENGQEIFTFQGHDKEVVCTIFDPQSSVLATGSLDQTAKVWDIRSGGEIKTIGNHTGELVSASYSADGNYLMTGSFDATVNIWDCRMFKLLHRLIGHRGEISNAVFNYTGTKVISGSCDGTVRIWDAIAGSCLKVISGHSSEILDVACSLNGKLMAAAASDGTCFIIDANTMTINHTLKGHQDETSKITFNSQGNLLLTASQDHTARLWSCEDGTCSQILDGHSDEVFSSIFSYDGDTIVTCSKDNNVNVWKCDGSRL